MGVTGRAECLRMQGPRTQLENCHDHAMGDSCFGYHCVKFVGDELALVGYHARDGIHVARIKIDWFYEQQ